MWSTIVTNNVTRTHDPNYIFQPADAETYGFVIPETNGALVGVKTGAFPGISFNVAADVALAAGTYSIEIEYLFGYQPAGYSGAQAQFIGNGRYQIGTTALGVQIKNNIIVGLPSPWESQVRLATDSFVLASPSSSIWLTVNVNTATGGIAGGCPATTRVTLVKTA